MTQKLSGLQRQVRACYRDTLKMVATKPLAHRADWFRFLAGQFRSPAALEAARRRDVEAIEYGLRRATSQLELYGHPAVRKVNPPAHSIVQLGWIAKGGKEGLGRR